MSPLIEGLYRECLRISDEEEIREILQIIQEAKDDGDDCEVFFLDEYPHIEGWCNYLKEIGYVCKYSGGVNTKAYVVSWN